jgi:hypothetical protein
MEFVSRPAVTHRLSPRQVAKIPDMIENNACDEPDYQSTLLQYQANQCHNTQLNHQVALYFLRGLFEITPKLSCDGAGHLGTAEILFAESLKRVSASVWVSLSHQLLLLIKYKDATGRVKY